MVELTRAEVCERLGVPASRIEYLLRERQVPEPRRVGRMRVWDEGGLQGIRNALARVGSRQ